jgi:hypothetical protein
MRSGTLGYTSKTPTCAPFATQAPWEIIEAKSANGVPSFRTNIALSSGWVVGPSGLRWVDRPTTHLGTVERISRISDALATFSSTFVF